MSFAKPEEPSIVTQFSFAFCFAASKRTDERVLHSGHGKGKKITRNHPQRLHPATDLRRGVGISLFSKDPTKGPVHSRSS